MPNPQLNSNQVEQANLILSEIRARLIEVTGADTAFHWALRRKIAKELTYDERGKPNHRRALKTIKRKEQAGLCPECQETLPPNYCVLDRLEAMGGYTVENTRLLCTTCDAEIQRQRGYK